MPFRLSVITVLISSVILSIHTSTLGEWNLDDAYISYRYAQNFANGHGLVFNPGEPVEGYTSFLWVALLGVLYRLGFDIVITAKTLSFTFAFAVLLMLSFIPKLISPFPKSVVIAATLFTASSGMFTAWAISGMEVSLFTLLILVSVLLTQRILLIPHESHILQTLAFCLTLTALTRPEGLLVVGIICGYLMIRNNKIIVLIHLVNPFVLMYGLYFIWRYTYYGFILPNTFYAKVGFEIYQVLRGILYTNQLLFAIGGMFIPIILYLFHRRYSAPLSFVHLPLCAFIVGSYAVYVILVGGDFMPALRFYAPMFPLLSIFTAAVLFSLTKNKQRTFVVGGIVLLFFNLYQTYTFPPLNAYIHHTTVADDGKVTGLWFKHHVPSGTTLATNAAGALPYYAQMITIDTLGLNNVHIAHQKTPDIGKGYAGHEKGDGQYVLSLKPDYILFRSSVGSYEPYFKGDQELANISEFLFNYRYITFIQDQKQIHLYQRINQM